MSRQRLTYFLLLCMLAVPVGYLLGVAPAELDKQNRTALARYQKHPDAAARLRQQLESLQALSETERARLLKLDRELHEQPSSVQARLLDTLQRYADWLERLPESERQQLAKAGNKQTRLAELREIRMRQWLAALPRAQREAVAARQGAERQKLMVALKQEEREAELQQQVAVNLWEALAQHRGLDCRMEELRPELQSYVNDYLKPMLSKEEREQLDKAQGRWPLFLMTLVELAERHPPALPGPRGPTRVGDLPLDLQKRLLAGKLKQGLAKLPQEWPSFASELTKKLGKHDNKKQVLPLPHELWPTRFDYLQMPMREFVLRLRQVLSREEDDFLRLAEGKWPQYPQAIQQLAVQHYLRPPWYTMPAHGRGEGWEHYRLPRRPVAEGLPEVAQVKLLAFAQLLSAKKRGELKIVLHEPLDVPLLTRVYFHYHPAELQRLREVDAQHLPRLVSAAPTTHLGLNDDEP